jgi:hypothetical protein
MEDYSLKSGKSLENLFNDLKEVLGDAEENKFFSEVQDKLFKEGYTGFTYMGGKGLQADVAHTVVQIFDHLDQNFIDDASSHVKDLNYENKKMLLDYNPAKKTSLLNEGYLSNGKKIILNEGYFENIADNPLEADKAELDALKGLFSKEQIDDIAIKTSKHDFRSISKNYPDLVGKKDLLLQVEDWKKFDNLMYGDIRKQAELAEKIYTDLLNIDNLHTPLAKEIYEQLDLTKEISDQLDQLKLTDDIATQLKLTEQIHNDIRKELTKDIYQQLKLTKEVDDQLESLFAKSMEEANLKTPEKMSEAIKAAIVCLRK